jgi:hypothetical protein
MTRLIVVAWLGTVIPAQLASPFAFVGQSSIRFVPSSVTVLTVRFVGLLGLGMRSGVGAVRAMNFEGASV